jgi:hypothetical protein
MSQPIIHQYVITRDLHFSEDWEERRPIRTPTAVYVGRITTLQRSE